MFEFDEAKSQSNLVKHGIDFLGITYNSNRKRLTMPPKAVTIS